jgi:hypothetical protein
MAYTSDDLIADIERDSFQPAAQDHFTTAQKLAIADQEIHQSLAPLLVSLDSGYFLEPADTALVADQAGYDLDRYAMWNKLRRVEILDADDVPREIVLATPEQRNNYDTVNSGTPVAFEMRHAQISLLPAPDSATETLRQWIYRRPGRLVPTSSAAVVVSQNGSGVITYTGAPPSTHTSSSVHDFYDGTSPFRRIATAATATGQSGSTQTFATATAALVAVGDYVCVRDETVFPAVPIELVPFLKDLVLRSMARTQMDEKAYQVQRQEIMDRAKAAFMAGPGARTVGHPKKISIPRSRVGRKGPRMVS